MNKRADVVLVEEKYFETRVRAQEAIKNGQVKVNGVVIKKTSQEIEPGQKIELAENILKYVSRGGLKLEKAIKEFKIDFNNKVVIDMGSSTGGFTQVSLLNGAKKVFAVDVGTNQLAEKLRQDPRVSVHEGTDIRNFPKVYFDESDIIVADISFISEIKILSAIYDKITNQNLVILIKPQFECGMEIAKKYKGLIKDYNLSKKIANKAVEDIKKIGFSVLGITDSPITGGDGNNEFIVLLNKK